MEFFDGFKWAVPKAFSDAVSLCRFEEGDMLYDTEKAYMDDWEKASKFIKYSLQIRYPTKVIGGATVKGGVFNNNWNSEVRIDLFKNSEKVGIGQIHTTQGRLYTALWKGELSILEKTLKEPSIPLSVQDVNKILDQTKQKAKEFSASFPVFVMARDMSNPVSRDKYIKVLTKLKKHLHSDPHIMTPEISGLINYKNIAPTVEVVFFSITGANADELHEMIKNAVYVKSKNAKNEMFRIAAHGIIYN